MAPRWTHVWGPCHAHQASPGPSTPAAVTQPCVPPVLSPSNDNLMDVITNVLLCGLSSRFSFFFLEASHYHNHMVLRSQTQWTPVFQLLVLWSFLTHSCVVCTGLPTPFLHIPTFSSLASGTHTGHRLPLPAASLLPFLHGLTQTRTPRPHCPTQVSWVQV